MHLLCQRLILEFVLELIYVFKVHMQWKFVNWFFLKLTVIPYLITPELTHFSLRYLIIFGFSFILPTFSLAISIPGNLAVPFDSIPAGVPSQYGGIEL